MLELLDDALDNLMSANDAAMVVAFSEDGKFYVRYAGREERYEDMARASGQLTTYLVNNGFQLEQPTRHAN